MNRFTHFLKSTLILLALAATAPLLQAQDKFPSKPVTIIVAFGAGGSGDILARTIAIPLGETLGQSVIVENRAGGQAVPGTLYVARAPADGYTILEYTSTLAINQVLHPNLPYDLLRDFTPLSYSFEAPLVLLTPGISPNRKLPDLVAYAKSKPGGISFGHGGSGSLSHLSGELLKRAMAVDAVSVPYKGNGPAMADLIGGRLDYYFAAEVDSISNVKAGRLNALAITGTDRSPSMPDVPTMVELGYKNFTPSISWGFLVPKATPAPVARQLQDAFAKAIAAPAFQERLRSLGVTSKNSGGADVMAEKVKEEMARWEPVIKAANIRPE